MAVAPWYELLASASQKAVPVVVTSTGWTWSAVFGAIQALGLTLLGGGLLLAWYRGRALIMGRNNDRAKIDGEITAASRDDDRDRIRDLEQRCDQFQARISSLTLQMSYLTGAFGLVSSELERLDPGNAVVKQARELIAQAAHAEQPFGPLVKKLDTMKGVGE